MIRRGAAAHTSAPREISRRAPALSLAFSLALVLGLLLAGGIVAGAGPEAGSGASYQTSHGGVAAAGASAASDHGTVATTGSLAATDHGSVERDGDVVSLTVPADRVDAAETVELTVTVGTSGERHGSAVTTATRAGDRYVAEVPVVELVAPDADAVLSQATVRASVRGTTVLEDQTDLRYVASAGDAGFVDANLSIDVDARGLGTETATLHLDDGSRIDVRIVGTGPDAAIRVPAPALADLSLEANVEFVVATEGSAVPGASLSFSVSDAARTATAIEYRDGDPVLVSPFLHPSIGPDPVTVRIETSEPNGQFAFRGRDSAGAREIPGELLVASDRRLRIVGDGDVLVERVLDVPAPETVTFRVGPAGLNATDPGRLAPYDAILVRSTADDRIERVPVDSRLRAGETSALPPTLEGLTEHDDGLLVGDGVRPAPATFEPAPDQPDPEIDEAPPQPDAQDFVGIWLDVGDGVALLLLAMIGSAGAVAVTFTLRLVRPAATPRAGFRGVVVHFVLGAVGGTATITAVQRIRLGTLTDPVSVAGVEVGLGALLVGVFYGGLTASAMRVGLGSTGAWPTQYGAGLPSVPVRVRVTDDGDNQLAGEQIVEIRRPGTGRVLRSVTVSGTEVEVKLPPGDYGVVASTGERETDPQRLRVPTPDLTVPETREAHVTFDRPGLQVEVTDAQTGAPVDGASVTVTTDAERTKTETATEGSAVLALPVETRSVTTVVDAEGYETTTVEQPIDQQVRTTDVALPPTSGTLAATALIDGEPASGVRLQVAPRADETSSIGDRRATLDTDAEGRASTELPAGDYGVTVALQGPNASLFDVETASVTVEPGTTAEVTVHASFRWQPGEQVQERAARVRSTVASVGSNATADPTIPVYFAGVAVALVDVVDDLPDAGHHFATATVEPGLVAAVAVDAARATLSAVGRAMQSEDVQRVLAAGGDPQRVHPDIDASPASLLAYLQRDDHAVGTIEARAQEVRETIANERPGLASVAPATAIVAVAVDLEGGADSPVQVAGRQYAALRLLDAVESLFVREPLRLRLGGGRTAEEESAE